MEMMPEENQEKEALEQPQPEGEEKLAEYVTDAIRGPKFGIKEQLLCQRLVMATVATDQLRSTELILGAAMMLEKQKKKSLEIDSKQVELLNAVCTGLTHKVSATLKNRVYQLVKVSFPFDSTEENYEKYIKIWHPSDNLHVYSDYVSQRFGENYIIWECACCGNAVADKFRGKFGYGKGSHDEECKFCGHDLNYDRFDNSQPFTYSRSFKWREDITDAKRFFASCDALTEVGYAELKSSFLNYVSPIVLDYTRRLTEAVRPEVYREVAKMFVEAEKETRGL